MDELETVLSRDRYSNEPLEDINNDYPDDVEKLEKASNNQKPENDFKFSKSEFPDKLNFVIKKTITLRIFQ